MEVAYILADSSERPYDSIWDMYYDEFEDADANDLASVGSFS